MAAGFTLTANPNQIVVLLGGSGQSTIMVAVSDGFNSAVALSITGPLPAGVTASLTPASTAAPGSGTSTLTLTAASSVSEQSSETTITGTGDGLTVTATVYFTIQRFMLTASSSSVALLRQGDSVNCTITSTIAAGFNGAISLSVMAPLPAGITAVVNPSIIAAPGSGTCSAALTATDALSGFYTVSIVGVSGNSRAIVQLPVEVFGPARVVKLRVRAGQAAILSFPIDGILEEMNTRLGATVTLFNLKGFYSNLGAVYSKSNPGPLASTPNDNSLLQFNSANIHAGVGSFRLAALRAEPAKAALDSAISNRQNSFYKKYIDISGITHQMQAYKNVSLEPDSTMMGNVFGNLVVLAGCAQVQWSMLKTQYETDSRTGVVTATKNEIQPSQTTAQGGTGVITTTISTNLTTAPAADPSASSATTTSNTPKTPAAANQNVTTTTGQITLNTDYGYRVPYIEGMAQQSRAVISLINQQYNQYLFGVQVPYVTTILTNELAVLDSSVKQLQLAYLNTMLTSPISGQVTGLFKNVGERVKAGEPVLRVEGPSDQDGPSFLLVGTLCYNEPIFGGGEGAPNCSRVSVTTTMWGNSGVAPGANPFLITFKDGYVLSARGNGDQENLWDVVVAFYKVQNPPPPNYCFDCDDTTVVISPLTGPLPGT